MTTLLLPRALAFALSLGIVPASAQQMSEHQLIGSLQQVSQTAPAVDIGVLVEEINANGGKGIAELPAWRRLAQLPQFTIDIEFENNSVGIMPESYRTLGVIADALHHPSLRYYKFLIVGHTNATGTAEHNLELSAKRADAILVTLATTFSVPSNRLIALGVGQDLPLEATDPKAAANRRVQLVNLGITQ
jgi:outer membrane protein OmpA-like peptidoglycan-associated protein